MQATASNPARKYRSTLVMLNFLSSAARDGLGPLVSTYLLVSAKWHEKDIGTVMFFNLISTGVFQTFAGDLVDKTAKKRWMCAFACLLVGLASASIVPLPSFTAVLVTRIIQGAGSAVIPPVISGITLGLVGPAAFDSQVPLNEIGNRLGNGAAALIAGALAYFIDPSTIFAVVLVTCLLAALLVLNAIPRKSINHRTARGQVDQQSSSSDPTTVKDTEEFNQPDDVSYQQQDSEDKKTSVETQLLGASSGTTGYMQLMRDSRIALFFFCVFTFHAANAAMLPLLGQMISIGRSESEAIPLAVLTILIGRFTMAAVAQVLNSRIHRHGRRGIFLFGFLSLPIRGVLISLFPNNLSVLLATEILDGIGDGTYGVMHQVVTRDLTAGTGRFNVVLGMVTTCHIAGAATSNLVGEHLASYVGYSMTFLILACCGLLPLLSFALFFPETRIMVVGHSETNPIVSDAKKEQIDDLTITVTVQSIPIATARPSKIPMAPHLMPGADGTEAIKLLDNPTASEFEDKDISSATPDPVAKSGLVDDASTKGQ